MTRATSDSLTVSKQPEDFGHVRVVLIVALNEDVLARGDDRGPGETFNTDGQRPATRHPDDRTDLSIASAKAAAGFISPRQ